MLSEQINGILFGFFYLAKDAQKLTTLADGEYLSLAAFAALLTSVNLATVLAV